MSISGEIDLAAQGVLDDLCLSSPVDAFTVADALGIVVCDGPRSCCLSDGLVFLGPTVRTERTHFDLAHELGHLILSTHDCRQCNAFASALLLPRREFLADCRRHGRDLLALKAMHPNASHEAIARRYAQLHKLTLWVCDYPPSDGARRYRAVGFGKWCERVAECEWLAQLRKKPSTLDGVTAFPVVDGDWVRVLVMR